MRARWSKPVRLLASFSCNSLSSVVRVCKLTLSSVGKGSGLGLAISKRLVELHGGMISACTSRSGGALFYFIVPLRVARAEQSHVTAVGGPPPSTSSSSLGTITASSSKLHVLNSFDGTGALAVPHVASTEHAGTALVGFAGRRVAVVEDAKVNRQLLIRTLQRLGCDVDGFDDGQALLDYIEQRRLNEQHRAGDTIVNDDVKIPTTNDTHWDAILM